MTKKSMLPLIWIAIVGLLLGGAFLIVARNSPTAAENSPAGYVH